MARPKRQDIIDSLELSEEDLVKMLDTVSATIDAFAAGDGEDSYNPNRVAAAKAALDTAKMHVSACFNEAPHRPLAYRAPKAAEPDDE